MTRFFALALVAAILGCGGDSTAPPPVPHLLQLSASGPTSIAAGGAVQLVLAVIDDHGNAMSGQVVMLTSSNPSLGSLNGSLFTSTGGVGTTMITATLGALTNSISITVGHGPPSLIAITGGNNETGFVRAPVAINPSVQVRDQFGNPISGAIVAFAVVAGGGTVGSPSATTDGNGNASTSWTLGSSVGSNRITATSAGVNPVAFDATGDSPYHIEIVYSPEVSAFERSVVDQAIAHWRRIITTDIGAVQFGPSGGSCGTNLIAANETVTGLRIYVKDTAMDASSNLLAAAGVCYVNTANALPVVAHFFWNTTQAANIATGGLVIATHELGHALGFGTLWAARSLLVGAGTADPFFIGPQARSAFSSGFGAGYVGNSVPVESTGGPATADSHWRETIFNNELMTGFINSGANPLSAVTIAQFADLGYTVDMSQAETFMGSILAPGTVLTSAPRLSLGDDVIRVPIRSVSSLRR